MQNIEYIYYKNKKVRFSFNFMNVNDVGNTLESMVNYFGTVYIRVEKGQRVYVMLRKSKTCMKAISMSQQKVQEEVLSGLKMTNCTFPRVFEVTNNGKRINVKALIPNLDDGCELPNK